MKPYFIKRKEDYRFTLLLATLFHILLFATLFITLRHAHKPFFLSASVPSPLIMATAFDSNQLPVSNLNEDEKEKVKLSSKVEKVIVKPELVEKSPVTLSSKRKPPKLVNTSSDIKSNLKKLAPSQKKHSDKLVQHKSNIMEKKKHPVVSKKSLQLAQKNVQQLLQQEVNTLVKKHQLAVQNTATTEKYRHLILQSIAQQWIIPPELNKHLEAKLVVRLAPGGMVLEVIVVKSSGNAILDRSAQTAVYKASPLPVPKSNLFNTFRQINLTVRPEGVLTQ